MELKDERPCWKVSSLEEQRGIADKCRKNEEAGPKQDWCSAVDMSGGESKGRCCQEQYCIEPWNIRSINQGKLDMAQ